MPQKVKRTMQDHYTPKQVCEATGASASALRIYTDRYARYLSTEATEVPRKFTQADLKLIAFIVQCTKARAFTHEQVEQALQAGELELFEWEPPKAAHQAQEPEQSTVLVPMAQVQALQVLLEDIRRREQEAQQAVQAVRTEATQREQSLQAEVNRLQNELGKAQGSLSTLQAVKRRPAWLRWFFGGE